MAVAGRVAIVPKGDYDVSAVYKKLDLVRYNHNAYVAKKPNTGIEPTDEEYWMLMIENVGATDLTELKEKIEGILDGTLSVENSNNLGNNPPSYYATSQSVTDIVEGTTPAGNAKKLNDLTVEEFVNNDSLLINGYFKDPVNSSGKTEWTGNSLVCIDKWVLESPVANGGIVELISDGVQLSVNTETTASYASLYQAINKLETGKKYTFSVSIDSATYALKVTGGQAQGGGTVLTENVRFYYLTTANNDSVFVRIFRDKGSAVINWAKLEIGSVATPLIPPNKEVEKLKCGATVGDAETVNGVKIYKTFTEINSTFTVNTPILDLVGAMENYSILITTVYNPTVEGLYPTKNGIIEVNKTGASNHTSLTFIERTTGKMWSGAVQHASSYWSGWSNSADGGNADTVGGFHVSEFAKSVDFFSATDFSFMQNRAGNNHYRLQLQHGVVALWESTDSGATWTKKSEWSTNYLPLDGSVPMSGNLYVNNGLGGVLAGANDTSLIAFNEQRDLSNCRSLILFNKNYIGDSTNALQFWDIINGQAPIQYTVLHTGNSNATIKSVTAPSDTTAIWIDTTNKKTKAYIDGAWTVIA